MADRDGQLDQRRDGPGPCCSRPEQPAGGYFRRYWGVDANGVPGQTAVVASQYASIVRDQVKRYDMTKMMSDPDTAKKIDDAVTQNVSALVKQQGLPIQIQNITLGRARPNPDVLQQMNLTAAQQQRVKTLVEATTAERQREQEQVAKADADNAYRNRMELTPEQYLASQIAELNAEACKKAQACYMVPSGTSVIAK